MLKTILTIVVSVTVFGILFFLYVKRSLKKKLDYYLSKNDKEWNFYIILQNFLNSSLGMSRTFLETS